MSKQVLLIGGPRNGDWIYAPTNSGQIVVSSSLPKSYYEDEDEAIPWYHRYNIQRIHMFGRVLNVGICQDLPLLVDEADAILKHIVRPEVIERMENPNADV